MRDQANNAISDASANRPCSFFVLYCFYPMVHSQRRTSAPLADPATNWDRMQSNGE